jgi:hypothetical protein
MTDNIPDILAERVLAEQERAILPDQAKRTAEGVMRHPLLRGAVVTGQPARLVAIDPNEDLL